MNSDWLLSYLDQMQQVAVEIGDFIRATSKDEFLNDVLKQRAVGMNLLMIGEVVSRLMDEFPDIVADHPEVPWMKMKGMRNRIAHGYFNIDLDTVWDTATKAVPELVETLQILRHWRIQGE
jgi:uncharacterized protein with HEPN domain